MGFNAERIKESMSRLGFPPGTALVHGSGALVLLGLIPEARDLDVALNEAGWQHALTLGTPRPASIDRKIEPAPGIELFDGWLGEPLAELFARAVPVDGLLAASPQDVLRFKKALGRPKDREHIRLLEAHTCNNH